MQADVGDGVGALAEDDPVIGSLAGRHTCPQGFVEARADLALETVGARSGRTSRKPPSSVQVRKERHEDQPSHLEVADPERGGQQLQVKSSTCMHCRTCDIEDPHQVITWTPPEGGGGPDDKMT